MASLPRCLTLTAALVLATAALAQTTYRWIDPATGKTVYSDRAPPAGAKQVLKTNAAEPASEPPLPYATRRAADKYPVTLYTAADCGEPCQKARALLAGRGVPYTEKVLKTPEELAELAKAVGAAVAAPTIFVGREHSIGYEDGAWNKLLDLASYPQLAPQRAKPQGVETQ